MPKILGVVDPSAEYARGVSSLISGQVEADAKHLPDVTTVDSFVRDAKPSVLVVGPGVEPDEALALGRRLMDADVATEVVLVASSVDANLLKSALRAGLHDVVCADDPASELVQAIKDAWESSRRRAGVTTESVKPEVAQGRVVSIFSTKGGVGKSIVATNLSVALAQDLGKRVVLVDLDLQFGDCGIMLGLQPAQTIAEAAAMFDRLDQDMLGSLLTVHRSGLRVLLAPVHPEQAESITPARITRIISLLAEMFDVVVLDTAANLDETVLTALDRSDRVYVLTMMDIASIKNTRISLQKLRQLGYPVDRMRLVLNRADSKVLLEMSDVERAVGSDISFRIPSDRLVPRSVNKGTPVVIDAPRSEVARTIGTLAKSTAELLKEASNVT